MSNTIRIHFLGGEREFGGAVDSERCVFRGLIIDGIEFGLDEYKFADLWHCDCGEFVGIGATAQEAAADLEAKLMPLAKLLAPMGESDRVRDLQRELATANSEILRLEKRLDDGPGHIASYSGIVAAHGAWETNGGKMPDDWFGPPSRKPTAEDLEEQKRLIELYEANMASLREREKRDTDASELAEIEADGMGGE
jgi:hypothetical protein